MSSGIGAGMGADMLQDILQRKLREVLGHRELANREASLVEQGRQADMQQSLGNRRVDEDARQFDGQAPVRMANVQHLNAGTGELLRKPQAEADERAFTTGRDTATQAFTTGRDKAQHGYQMSEIGAQGANALKVANVRGEIAADARGNRPPTGAERQTLAFFNRALEGDKAAAKLEDAIASAGLGSQLQQQHAPNMLQTTEQQQYRQAQRAFTEARLRKESGAAINPSEYENDNKTYFAQPGDSPEVRKQKRTARQTLLKGLGNASGHALREFYGEDANLDALIGGEGAGKSGTVRARDPQGNLHEAPAGTPLPAGWKVEGGA
jgi:hypothetical protein